MKKNVVCFSCNWLILLNIMIPSSINSPVNVIISSVTELNSIVHIDQLVGKAVFNLLESERNGLDNTLNASKFKHMDDSVFKRKNHVKDEKSQSILTVNHCVLEVTYTVNVLDRPFR